MRAKVSFILLVCFALSMNRIVYATSENPKSNQTQPSTVTVPDDFSTLQEALKNAEHGATVYLKEGVYSITSPITIAQNVSIIGIGKPTVEFSGEGKILVKTGESVEVKKDAPNVTLEGIKFIGKYGESEFKELENLGTAYRKGREKEFDDFKEHQEFMMKVSALLEEVDKKSNVMTEQYPLITILAGFLSMKNCAVSCDSGAALRVVGDKSFLTASDSLFEKNGSDAVVVTESEVSFNSCAFANNSRCSLFLEQDAKGVLTNCTINDSLIGIKACEDSNLIVEKTLISGCCTAILCSSSSSLRLLEVKLINSIPYNICISDYSKALVTRTFFSDAPVHIYTVNHAETHVYDSTFSSGNVAAFTLGQKTTVHFDGNCKFHNLKYKLLDESTVITTHNTAILNLIH